MNLPIPTTGWVLPGEGSVTDEFRDTILERPSQDNDIGLGDTVPENDDADLPLGAPRDPLNLDGGAPGNRGGAGTGGNTPVNDLLGDIPWTKIVLAVLAIVTLQAFASGAGEGLTA